MALPRLGFTPCAPSSCTPLTSPFPYADHAKGKAHCAHNPNCVFGWKESRKGIWSDAPSLLSALGPDPAGRARDPCAQPAGIINLGATCYLNALVQALYSILPLRAALMAWVPAPDGYDPTRALAAERAALGQGGGQGGEGWEGGSGVELLHHHSLEGANGTSLPAAPAQCPCGKTHSAADPPPDPSAMRSDMRALQAVFALLHGSTNHAVLEPVRAFVDLFNLQRGEQQDATEFFLLLAEHLEGILVHSTHLPPAIRGVKSWLFKGTTEVRRGSRCCAGGQQTPPTRRASHFEHDPITPSPFSPLLTAHGHLQGLRGAQQPRGGVAAAGAARLGLLQPRGGLPLRTPV